MARYPSRTMFAASFTHVTSLSTLYAPEKPQSLPSYFLMPLMLSAVSPISICAQKNSGPWPSSLPAPASVYASQSLPVASPGITRPVPFSKYGYGVMRKSLSSDQMTASSFSRYASCIMASSASMSKCICTESNSGSQFSRSRMAWRSGSSSGGLLLLSRFPWYGFSARMLYRPAFLLVLAVRCTRTDSERVRNSCVSISCWNRRIAVSSFFTVAATTYAGPSPSRMRVRPETHPSNWSGMASGRRPGRISSRRESSAGPGYRAGPGHPQKGMSSGAQQAQVQLP